MASRKTTVPNLYTVGPPIPATAQAQAVEKAARSKSNSKAGTGAKAQAGKTTSAKAKPKASTAGKEPTKAEIKAAFRRCTDNLTTAAQAFARLGKAVEVAASPLPDPALPQPRNWRGSDEFRYVRDGILAALRKSGRDADPLVLDKVDEYMDFWVQRRMLAEDVETRGLMVTDDRGRLQENRSASLGVQVSKQMAALASQLGLIAKAKPTGKAADAPEEGDEEDEL